MHICNFMDEERPSSVINNIFLRQYEEYIVPDTFQHQNFDQFWFLYKEYSPMFCCLPQTHAVAPDTPSPSLHQRKIASFPDPLMYFIRISFVTFYHI